MKDSSNNKINPSSPDTLGIKKPLGCLSPLGQSFISPKFISPLGARSIARASNVFANDSEYFIHDRFNRLANTGNRPTSQIDSPSTSSPAIDNSPSVRLKPQAEAPIIEPRVDRDRLAEVDSNNFGSKQLQRQIETNPTLPLPLATPVSEYGESSSNENPIQQQPSISKDNLATNNSSSSNPSSDRPAKKGVRASEQTNVFKKIDSSLGNSGDRILPRSASNKLTSFIQQKSESIDTDDSTPSSSSIPTDNSIQDKPTISRTEVARESNLKASQQNAAQSEAISAEPANSSASALPIQREIDAQFIAKSNLQTDDSTLPRSSQRSNSQTSNPIASNNQIQREISTPTQSENFSDNQINSSRIEQRQQPDLPAEKTFASSDRISTDTSFSPTSNNIQKQADSKDRSLKSDRSNIPDRIQREVIPSESVQPKADNAQETILNNSSNATFNSATEIQRETLFHPVHSKTNDTEAIAPKSADGSASNPSPQVQRYIQDSASAQSHISDTNKIAVDNFERSASATPQIQKHPSNSSVASTSIETKQHNSHIDSLIITDGTTDSPSDTVQSSVSQSEIQRDIISSSTKNDSHNSNSNLLDKQTTSTSDTLSPTVQAKEIDSSANLQSNSVSEAISANNSTESTPSTQIQRDVISAKPSLSQIAKSDPTVADNTIGSIVNSSSSEIQQQSLDPSSDKAQTSIPKAISSDISVSLRSDTASTIQKKPIENETTIRSEANLSKPKQIQTSNNSSQIQRQTEKLTTIPLSESTFSQVDSESIQKETLSPAFSDLDSENSLISHESIDNAKVQRQLESIPIQPQSSPDAIASDKPISSTIDISTSNNSIQGKLTQPSQSETSNVSNDPASSQINRQTKDPLPKTDYTSNSIAEEDNSITEVRKKINSSTSDVSPKIQQSSVDLPQASTPGTKPEDVQSQLPTQIQQETASSQTIQSKIGESNQTVELNSPSATPPNLQPPPKVLSPTLNETESVFNKNNSASQIQRTTISSISSQSAQSAQSAQSEITNPQTISPRDLKDSTNSKPNSTPAIQTQRLLSEETQFNTSNSQVQKANSPYPIQSEVANLDAIALENNDLASSTVPAIQTEKIDSNQLDSQPILSNTSKIGTQQETLSSHSIQPKIDNSQAIASKQTNNTTSNNLTETQAKSIDNQLSKSNTFESQIQTEAISHTSVESKVDASEAIAPNNSSNATSNSATEIQTERLDLTQKVKFDSSKSEIQREAISSTPIESHAQNTKVISSESATNLTFNPDPKLQTQYSDKFHTSSTDVQREAVSFTPIQPEVNDSQTMPSKNSTEPTPSTQIQRDTNSTKPSPSQITKSNPTVAENTIGSIVNNSSNEIQQQSLDPSSDKAQTSIPKAIATDNSVIRFDTASTIQKKPIENETKIKSEENLSEPNQLQTSNNSSQIQRQSEKPTESAFSRADANRKIQKETLFPAFGNLDSENSVSHASIDSAKVQRELEPIQPQTSPDAVVLDKSISSIPDTSTSDVSPKIQQSSVDLPQVSTSSSKPETVDLNFPSATPPNLQPPPIVSSPTPKHKTETVFNRDNSASQIQRTTISSISSQSAQPEITNPQTISPRDLKDLTNSKPNTNPIQRDTSLPALPKFEADNRNSSNNNSSYIQRQEFVSSADKEVSQSDRSPVSDLEEIAPSNLANSTSNNPPAVQTQHLDSQPILSNPSKIGTQQETLSSHSIQPKIDNSQAIASKQTNNATSNNLTETQAQGIDNQLAKSDSSESQVQRKAISSIPVQSQVDDSHSINSSENIHSPHIQKGEISTSPQSKINNSQEISSQDSTSLKFNTAPAIQTKKQDSNETIQSNTSKYRVQKKTIPSSATQPEINDFPAIASNNPTDSACDPSSIPVQRQINDARSGDRGKTTFLASEQTVTELLQTKAGDRTQPAIQKLGVIEPLNSYRNKNKVNIQPSALPSKSINSQDKSQSFTSSNSKSIQRKSVEQVTNTPDSWSNITELMAKTNHSQQQIQTRSSDSEFKSNKTKTLENWTIQKSAFLPPGVWQSDRGATSLSFMGQPQDVSTKARQNIEARTKLKDAASNLSGKKLPPIKSEEIKGDGIENFPQVTVQTSTEETETTTEETNNNDTQHAQNIDILAREIYGLLRQQLEIERERHGGFYRRFS